MCDEQLPTLIVIASHMIQEKSKRILKRSPSEITEIYFLDLGEENIRKRLNTVRKKIKSNEHLSEKMN